ncbi:hypothetical protein XarbCFBP8150_00680 [Xanthomonas arboricola]|nr:hypothetical protein XarbCFBP8150_00680 [Xanthomonas arboricola]
MPRKSLHGRTCGVSCEGGRARTSQPSRRSSALQPTPPIRSTLQTETNHHSSRTYLTVGVDTFARRFKPWPPA